jgi:hypothetical protein
MPPATAATDFGNALENQVACVEKEVRAVKDGSTKGKIW